MKKTLFLSILLCNTYLFTYSQDIYYDAIALSAYVDEGEGVFKDDPESIAAISTILANYCDELPTDASLDEVLTSYSTDTTGFPCSNPILQKYLEGISPFRSMDVAGRAKSLVSSIGHLNVTNFADGLAKFLVARAKEELNVAFFQRFKEYLLRYPEVEVIFPHTYDFLDEIYAYQYAAMLPALRSGFLLDLNNFSENFIKLRKLTEANCPGEKLSSKKDDCKGGDTACMNRIKDLHAYLNTHPTGRTFVAALLVSNSIIKGDNASEILGVIANDEVCAGRTDNFSNIIRFSDMLSGSLRSRDQNAIWIKKSEIQALLQNEHAFKIYLGLLYAKDHMRPDPIQFKDGDHTITLQELLVEAYANVNNFMTSFKKELTEVGYNASDVSTAARRIGESPENISESTILLYADYAQSISNFLKASVSFFNSRNPRLAEDVKLFTTLLDDATASCYDIKSQNYTSLVLHTSHILEELIEDFSFKDDYLKYGNFMAGIVEADNSDEVKAAIEAAVLPVGSASIKRQTNSNISLNAYIGPMVGLEKLGALKEDEWATIVGLTAPVGVAFSWGNYGNGMRDDSQKVKDSKKCGVQKGGHSISLFVPLIDVGALATFRLNDEDSHVAADIELENIIAPGLYLYWGIPKVPISIGLGGQAGPQLRTIDSEDVEIDRDFYLRFGLNIAVDIPLFNFYTKN